MTQIREARDRLAWGGSPPELTFEQWAERRRFFRGGWTILDDRGPIGTASDERIDVRFRDGARLNAVLPGVVDWSRLGRASDAVAWRFTVFNTDPGAVPCS